MAMEENKKGKDSVQNQNEFDESKKEESEGMNESSQKSNSEDKSFNVSSKSSKPEEKSEETTGQGKIIYMRFYNLLRQGILVILL